MCENVIIGGNFKFNQRYYPEHVYFYFASISFRSVYINMRVVVTVMNLACLMLCSASLIHHFRTINVNPDYSY
jgi:hypothetical protein